MGDLSLSKCQGVMMVLMICLLWNSNAGYERYLSLQKSLSESQILYSKMSGRVESSEKQLEDLKAAQAQEIEVRSHEIEEMSREIEKRSREIEEMSQEMENKSQEIEKKSREIDELKSDQHGLQNDLNLMRTDIEELKKSISEAEIISEESDGKMKRSIEEIKSAVASILDNPVLSPKRGTQESRAIISISLRNRGHHNAGGSLGDYCLKRFRRIAAYAESIGADWFLINNRSHPALTLNNLDLDVHYYKFPAIQYYLERYDAVIWMDDTILLNKDCTCLSNLFEFSLEFVGVEEPPRRELSDLCNQIKGDAELWAKYNDSSAFRHECGEWRNSKVFPLFNSGLMLIRKKHMKIFEAFRKDWEFKAEWRKRSADQGLFNFLVHYHGIKWVDLNSPTPLVIQGSKMAQLWVEGKPDEFTCIGHATKGVLKFRHELICDDWEYCTPEAIANRTVNEALSSEDESFVTNPPDEYYDIESQSTTNFQLQDDVYSV